MAQSFTKTEYAVGSSPKGIVSADFNQDGVADLAVANSGSASVSLLLGHADGTFGAATTLVVAANPAEITTADFNNDGIPDIAVACNGAITILYMHGDTTATRFDYLINGTTTSVVVADFNGDSKPDIAAATAGEVLVLLNHFDESFSASATLTPEVPATVVRAADLNRDGVMDLAIAACCQGEDVQFGAGFIAIGQGDGTFALSKAFDFAGGNFLSLADITRDGQPDLILPYLGCHTPCSGVEVATNQGGAFQRTGGQGLDTLLYTMPGQAVVADFNGDGIPDVAVPFAPGDYEIVNGSNYDKVLVFTGSGDGKFSSSGDYVIGTGEGPFGMVTVDFNHDGRPDMAVSDTKQNKITVFLNNTGSSADQQFFELHTSPSSQSVKGGDKVQFEYFLDPTNGALPNITLSCSGLPQGATCTFDPVNGPHAALGFITIQTASTTGALRSSNMLTALAFLLPMGLIAIPSARRRNWKFGGALLVLCLVAMLQLGCGGVSSTPATPATNVGGGSDGPPPANNDGSGNNNGGSGGGTNNSGSGGSGGDGGASNSGPGTYQVTISASGGGITNTETVTLNVQ